MELAEETLPPDEEESNTTSRWSSFVAFWTPKRSKSFILLLVFVSCTIYQFYAGLRVATMETGTHSNHGDGGGDSSHNHDWKSTLKIVLLCATVLWINAEAYILRVLIVELTRREEGLLFLPPEVHRHPLYLETDHRSIAMHWCDLCQQRISAPTATTVCQPATSGRGSNNSANSNNRKEDDKEKGWCYRCALCDFDICIACSKRNDAAIVGENVLRGDQGVRTETSLTTSQYVKRSIAVAGKSEWPWLLVSFALLALSSLSRLFFA